jgi:hypothetical protein
MWIRIEFNMIPYSVLYFSSMWIGIECDLKCIADPNLNKFDLFCWIRICIRIRIKIIEKAYKPITDKYRYVKKFNIFTAAKLVICRSSSTLLVLRIRKMM